MIVSHSQDFMNGVCTNVIHMTKKKLEYYSGNYDQFIKTQIELCENQEKRYNWEQSQLNHMKDYIARFGHGSKKLARQAQSKEKTMAKMVAGGLTEKVVSEKVKAFCFFDPGTVPPPVIMVQHVSFRYSPTTPWIYKWDHCLLFIFHFAEISTSASTSTRVSRSSGPTAPASRRCLSCFPATSCPATGSSAGIRT